MRSHQLGKEGEEFARRFLGEQGYEVLTTNYRTPIGEIDIVARENGVLCFIEVKTRGQSVQEALEAVHPRKQRTLFRCAQAYLQKERKTEEVLSRFDVLALVENFPGEFDAELIRDAF